MRFERAQATDFRDHEALLAANQAFSKAIEADPLFLEPYLCLGYLLALYGLKYDALACVGIVQAINPGSEPAQALKAYIEKLGDGSPIGPAHADHADHDDLYDRLRRELEIRVRQVTDQSQALSWTGIPTQNALQALHRFCWQLGQDYHDLYQRLSALDAEVESSELFLRLGILEKQLCQLNNRLVAGQHFLDLHTELEGDIAAVEALLLHAGPGSREAALEGLLDRCDAFADRLDQLDAQGHDILVLKPTYKQLVHRLELLQEAVEDSDTEGNA